MVLKWEHWSAGISWIAWKYQARKLQMKLLIVSACRWLSVLPSYHVLKYYFPVGWLFSLLPSSQKLQFVILYSDHLNWGHWSFHSWRAALLSNIEKATKALRTIGTERRMQIHLLVNFNENCYGKWRSDYQLRFEIFF